MYYGYGNDSRFFYQERALLLFQGRFLIGDFVSSRTLPLLLWVTPQHFSSAGFIFNSASLQVSDLFILNHGRSTEGLPILLSSSGSLITFYSEDVIHSDPEARKVIQQPLQLLTTIYTQIILRQLVTISILFTVYLGRPLREVLNYLSLQPYSYLSRS